MIIPENVAQAVWEYPTRTLISGVPDAPTNRAEEIAKAVWEYATRTLTAYPSWWYAGGGTGGRKKESTHLGMLLKQDDEIVIKVIKIFLGNIQ